MNVVLSCYLTQRPDPQRGTFWSKDDPTQILPWAKSVVACGLRGIVFHDGVTLGFTDQIITGDHDRLRFYERAWQTPWTAAEERAMMYLDWLTWTPPDWAISAPVVDKVLMTDISDVQIYENPFAFMCDPGTMYVGSEPLLIGQSPWMKERMIATYGEITDADKPILNPGIIGGSKSLVCHFLRDWISEMCDAPDPVSPPHDIVSFNRVLYRGKFRYVTGHPLHTVFRQNQGPESGAYIRHK